MDRPPIRPESVLIRLAREAAGISVPDAAARSGVSKARWSQVEAGYETRNKILRPVQAKPGTLARMAHAVGLSPERLASEGERQDAAEILREIQRGEAPSRPEPVRPVADEADTDPAADLFPGDEVLQAIWRQTGVSEENRAAQVRAIRLARERALDEGRRTAGLAAHGEPALADIL